MRSSWWLELGLVCKINFWSKIDFYIALLMGPITLGFIWWLYPVAFNPMTVTAFSLFLMIVWQPLIEELFFRGVLQGQLIQKKWFAHQYWGLSRANVLVSLLFVLAHIFAHSMLWALAVFLPSLVFGWFRDRYQCIYPALVLHSFYNAVLVFFVTYLLI